MHCQYLLIRALLNGHNCENSFDIQLLGQEKCLYNYGLLSKSTEQRLEELARRNVENIRWSMLQNLNISFARFASRIKERLTETVTATKGAMEAARVRRSSTGGSVAAEVVSKGNLIGSLESLKSDFIALQSGLP
jgi:hypothetical protein